MTRRSLSFLATLALLSTLTACGGNKIDGAHSSTAATPSTSVAPRPLGSRPKDVSLKEVDPCQVLTDEQLQQLRYSKTRRPDKGNRLDEPQCSVGNSFGPPPNLSSLISLVVNEDISAWLTPERQGGLASSNKITVAGFPALEMTGKRLKDDCQVVVDVADGQYLDVFSTTARERGTSPEPFCVEARRVAEMAVQTLLARS
ncbi:hypothetical protein GCM10022247_09170 [Allokutzneria multivorans]|uniref:DUF3558 domain-containing protein n=1 Tax=Allokutzneria multivorans TaxID=1142134 RepID=A0ABP7R3X7_9PSEU